MSRKQSSGFTLIELSIVLVIIGLLTGGILMGKDLIKAAEIRNQIKQIEQYNTAAHAFKAKYSCLPGDCPAQTAIALGFFTRTGNRGDGDGDGLIDVIVGSASSMYTNDNAIGGENVLFWTDLYAAHMITDKLTDSSDSIQHPWSLALWKRELPQAKMGGPWNFITVYGHSPDLPPGNYFQIINTYTTTVPSYLYTLPALTPQESSSIDQKIDDGWPLQGTVLAMTPDTTVAYSYPGTKVKSPGYTLCVNNAGGGVITYNTAGSLANVVNCTLSFKASF